MSIQSKVLSRMMQITRDAGLDPVDESYRDGSGGQLLAMDDDFNTIAIAHYSFSRGTKSVWFTRPHNVPNRHMVDGFGALNGVSFTDTEGEKIRAMLGQWKTIVNDPEATLPVSERAQTTIDINAKMDAARRQNADHA